MLLLRTQKNQAKDTPTFFACKKRPPRFVESWPSFSVQLSTCYSLISCTMLFLVLLLPVQCRFSVSKHQMELPLFTSSLSREWLAIVVLVSAVFCVVRAAPLDSTSSVWTGGISSNQADRGRPAKLSYCSFQNDFAETLGLSPNDPEREVDIHRVHVFVPLSDVAQRFVCKRLEFTINGTRNLWQQAGPRLDVALRQFVSCNKVAITNTSSPYSCFSMHCPLKLILVAQCRAEKGSDSPQDFSGASQHQIMPLLASTRWLQVLVLIVEYWDAGIPRGWSQNNRPRPMLICTVPQ